MIGNLPNSVSIVVTALAPIIWGSTYIVTTELLPADRPYTAALIRVLPAGFLLLLMSFYLPKRKEWGRLIILSALNIGLFQGLLFVAAYRLPGGIAAVVGAIQPLLLMLLIWLVDSKAPRVLTVIAATFGVIGMAALLLSPNAEWDLWGIIAAFLGACSMGAGTYLAKRWHSSLPVLAFTGWQLLLGGLMLLPAAYFLDPALPVLGSTEILSYAYLSIFGALIAYLLWFKGIAILPPVAVSSLGLLSPVTAVVLGWWFLDQSLQGFALLGLITVLVSILVVQISSSPKPISRSKQPVVAEAKE